MSSQYSYAPILIQKQLTLNTEKHKISYHINANTMFRKKFKKTIDKQKKE